MSKRHTPGPWHIGLPSPFKVEVVAVGGGIIAELDLSNENVGSYVVDALDNFMLISAAPEMFEALRVLLSRLEAENDSGQCLADQLGFEYDDARKAIAKAEGRE